MRKLPREFVGGRTLAGVHDQKSRPNMGKGQVLGLHSKTLGVVIFCGTTEEFYIISEYYSAETLNAHHSIANARKNGLK